MPFIPCLVDAQLTGGLWTLAMPFKSSLTGRVYAIEIESPIIKTLGSEGSSSIAERAFLLGCLDLLLFFRGRS